jgi:hypothetical protein
MMLLLSYFALSSWQAKRNHSDSFEQ